jgi:putative redox protein
MNLSFAPNELLASSLAAFTSITLRMYANRKGWKLTDVKVEVTIDTDPVENKNNMGYSTVWRPR